MPNTKPANKESFWMSSKLNIIYVLIIQDDFTWLETQGQHLNLNILINVDVNK